MNRLVRKATYAGRIDEKDQLDILSWSNKSPSERLFESWRLHCLNHNIPIDTRLDKSQMSAKKRHSNV